jgi:hypothetical protein
MDISSSSSQVTKNADLRKRECGENEQPTALAASCVSQKTDDAWSKETATRTNCIDECDAGSGGSPAQELRGAASATIQSRWSITPAQLTS